MNQFGPEDWRNNLKFFKPEDFEGTYENYQTGVLKAMADKANAKLEREGKVVVGDPVSGGTFQFEKHYGYIQTHKAILINIEPIEKCKHPSEKVNKHYYCVGKEVLDPNDFTNNLIYQCECGARVTPPVGNWVEVNE